jgi:hypothetical protein
MSPVADACLEHAEGTVQRSQERGEWDGGDIRQHLARDDIPTPGVPPDRARLHIDTERRVVGGRQSVKHLRGTVGSAAPAS